MGEVKRETKAEAEDTREVKSCTIAIWIASPCSASEWISPEVTQVASPGCLRHQGKKPQPGDTSGFLLFTGTFLLPPIQPNWAEPWRVSSLL